MTGWREGVRSFPFSADFNVKHEGPESNAKAAASEVLFCDLDVVTAETASGKGTSPPCGPGWVGVLNQSQRGPRVTTGMQCPCIQSSNDNRAPDQRLETGGDCRAARRPAPAPPTRHGDSHRGGGRRAQ